MTDEIDSLIDRLKKYAKDSDYIVAGFWNGKGDLDITGDVELAATLLADMQSKIIADRQDIRTLQKYIDAIPA